MVTTMKGGKSGRLILWQAIVELWNMDPIIYFQNLFAISFNSKYKHWTLVLLQADANSSQVVSYLSKIGD